MTIILSELSKSFAEQVVVSNVSLQVGDGELFVLLGSSGSGKSTILRLISGLLVPDAGRIELHGREVTRLPPQKRGVGFVFQNYAIFKHMTVAENVEFGLKIRKISQEERKRRRDEMLELVGLAGLGDRLPTQISGGQRQRVALARALVYEPAVLLLDEPFGALDAKIRSQLRRTLREVQQELKVSTILVTHDQEEAFELADRIGVLERGRLIEVGTPFNLYHHPQTETVATFLGGGNVVVARSEGDKIRLGSTLLPIPTGTTTHEEGAPMRILFRPETVEVQEKDFGPESGIFSLGQGKLVERNFAGPVERLRFELETFQGARPLEPALAYGQRFASVEVTRKSTANLNHAMQTPGALMWLGVRNFHVLQPTGMKILAYSSRFSLENPVTQACRTLGLASHGKVLLMGIAESGTSVDEERKKLEVFCHSLLTTENLPNELHIDFKIREGSAHRQLVKEVQEGFYDLIVLEGEPAVSEGESAREVQIRRLLESRGVPILVAARAPSDFKRVLLCTAAGEPGKSDVRFGARLTRHTRSFTTIFHVPAPGLPAGQSVRLMRHLEQASALFQAYDVPCEIKLGQTPWIESLLREAKEGNYDLIIIGAPGRSRRSSGDLVSQIIKRSGKSVLIVPSLDR